MKIMNQIENLISITLLAALSFAIILFVLFLVFNYIFPLFTRGISFVPTAKERIRKMIEFAAVKKGDKAADLGSGDGCLLVALAQAGAEAHGYEINPLLVVWSKMRIKKTGLSEKVKIYNKNLWQVDFSDYDIVFIYGFIHMMAKLEKKLVLELRPGARFVSNAFALPTWKPIRKENGVYLYKKI